MTITGLLSKAGVWRRRHIPDGVFIFIVAFFIGALAGFASFVLKELIGFVTEVAVGPTRIDSANYRLADALSRSGDVCL